MDPKDFTADGIRARLQRQRDAVRAEVQAQTLTCPRDGPSAS
jgi:hypothetical protein